MKTVQNAHISCFEHFLRLNTFNALTDWQNGLCNTPTATRYQLTCDCLVVNQTFAKSWWLTMGRKSRDSFSIGGEALKYFIAIVNLVFQRFSSNSQQTTCDFGNERELEEGRVNVKRVIIRCLTGLKGSWINLKESKFGEMYLTGT